LLAEPVEVPQITKLKPEPVVAQVDLEREPLVLQPRESIQLSLELTESVLVVVETVNQEPLVKILPLTQ
jgi:hypothetical protein